MQTEEVIAKCLLEVRQTRAKFQALMAAREQKTEE